MMRIKNGMFDISFKLTSGAINSVKLRSVSSQILKGSKKSINCSKKFIFFEKPWLKHNLKDPLLGEANVTQVFENFRFDI